LIGNGQWLTVMEFKNTPSIVTYKSNGDVMHDNGNSDQVYKPVAYQPKASTHLIF